MATFTTRVELHSAKWPDDYDILHAAMETEGFSRNVRGDDGVTYRLPTAEYDRTSTLDKNEIIESARRAAMKTGKEFSIFVTEAKADGQIWINLCKVEKQT